MRSMVGRYDIYRIIVNGIAQSDTVFQRLDRRIPFDSVTKLSVIAVMEPKVMHTHLAGDLLLAQRNLITQQCQFFGSRQMQDMQT